MIYCCCALHFEAQPIIEYFSMKKLDVNGRFQFFRGERAVLVLSGTGSFNANAAVTMLCTMFPPSKGDVFINYGICGAFKKKGAVGELVMAYSAENASSGKVIYTDIDIIMKAPFRKVALKTFDREMCCDMQGELADIADIADIADMEGYGAAFAAGLFFESHQIFILKTVSDIVGEGLPDNECAKSVAASAAEDMLTYAEAAETACAEFAREQSGAEFSDSEKAAAEEFSNALCLSAAMQEQLLCILRRRRILGKSTEFVLKSFLEDRQIENEKTCRREGKALFAEFKKYEVCHD